MHTCMHACTHLQCSGAFHSCKPSDLMAELQGRLPIRVELKALSREDFYRILTEPQFSILKQQQVQGIKNERLSCVPFVTVPVDWLSLAAAL